MVNNELQHWGIKGMRWGIRRFQNKDGSLTKAGKNRYSGDDAKTETKQETKEEYEARKQQALKSGSAKDVLQFKGDLTKQEMETAIARIRWEQDMSNLSAKEVSDGKIKADKFFDKVGDVTGYAVTATKAWNTFANVYNAFSGTDKVSLPTIATDNTKSNKNTRREEKKKLDASNDDKKQDGNNKEKNKDKNDNNNKSDKNNDVNVKVSVVLDDKLASGNNVSSGKTSGSEASDGKSSGSKTKTRESNKDNRRNEPIDAEWREVSSDDRPSATKVVVRKILNSDNLVNDTNVSAGQARAAEFLEAPKKDDD